MSNPSEHFAMTISDRYIGKAWLAWIMARRWLWRPLYSAFLYLWLFNLRGTAA